MCQSLPFRTTTFLSLFPFSSEQVLRVRVVICRKCVLRLERAHTHTHTPTHCYADTHVHMVLYMD